MYDPARDKWGSNSGNGVKASVAATSSAAPLEPRAALSPPYAAKREANGSLYGSGRTSGFKRRRESNNAGDDRVRKHYNSIQTKSLKNRKESAIYGVRTFNNFIKALLIDKYTHPHDIVLDYACGKGGDLMKWLKAAVDGVIGVDIAEGSIADAKRRYNELNSKTFWVDFVPGNLFEEDIEDIVHPDAFPVDAVSCQFALHYAFDTEQRARCALANISRALKKGGTFIGTIPSSDYLSRNLKSGQKEWGNSIFGIKFNEEHPDGQFDSMFGTEYTFHLAEAVENVPEYVIQFDKFVELASEYNLKLEFSQSFQEFFYSSLRDNDVQIAAERQKLVNRNGDIIIDPEELEACSIYLAFVFVKI